jgi:hypothetical protein
VIFIVALLHERDPRVLIAQPHVECRTARADRQRPIAQLSGKVEGLADRLGLRQTQRILGHLRLDARPHLSSRSEVAVRRRQALEPLMRALEVVVLDVKRHATLTVLKVGEHRAAEQLLPQRLPEPLDLAAGLRVMRTALHMIDAVALQLRLELRASSPRGVLPPLIGQDLSRRAIVGDAAREPLEHQDAPLVMRHRKTHQVAGVIIQERCHVDALVPPEQERKKIRLPQLVGLGAFEVLHGLLAPHPLR